MTRDVLAPENRLRLAQFTSSNVLAAFDFDGTLAPIVGDREAARMRRRTRDLLAEVSRAFPTVVISGRRQADVQARLDGVEVFAAIGNHGAEPWRCTEEDRRRVAEWTVRVRTAVGHLPGVAIEDKTFSLAVHYRHAPDVPAARAAILDAAATLAGVRVLGGKRVWNLLPRTAADKGAALDMARTCLGCDCAIYVGDDDTDEDVFRLDAPGRLLTVRVGGDASSKATFSLTDQGAMDELLQALLALRRERPAAAAPARPFERPVTGQRTGVSS